MQSPNTTEGIPAKTSIKDDTHALIEVLTLNKYLDYQTIDYNWARSFLHGYKNFLFFFNKNGTIRRYDLLTHTSKDSINISSEDEMSCFYINDKYVVIGDFYGNSIGNL